MTRFIEGENRFQATLFPQRLDEYIADDNPVRVIEAFVNRLDLKDLGFERAEPSEMGRPAYDARVMLKIYVYGYMNRLNTTRVLEQETHRNVDLLWLTGWLKPDHKTIGEFRRKNRKAIRRVCTEFVGLCRELKLFNGVIVAIDGSKFKAVNSRDKNFTRKSIKRRMKNLQGHIDRYMAVLDEADKREPECHNEYRYPAGERLTYKRSREEKGRKLLVYRTFKCPGCPLKAQCTTGKDRRIERWEHEQVLEDAADNLRKNAGAMRLRKQIVEHPYGTIKHRMGATHFVMKRLPNVQAEMSLHVLAYNLKRVINIVGVPTLMAQLQAV